MEQTPIWFEFIGLTTANDDTYLLLQPSYIYYALVTANRLRLRLAKHAPTMEVVQVYNAYVASVNNPEAHFTECPNSLAQILRFDSPK